MPELMSSMLPFAAALAAAAPSGADAPVRLVAEAVGDAVRIRVVGRSASALDARYALEVSGRPGGGTNRSTQRGTVRLRSCDFRDKPKVDPRYFTDAEGHDARVMIAGIRKAREIVAQSPMGEWAGEEQFPGQQTQSDEEIFDYIKRTHNTVYHPAGTVRMGAVSDTDSPLDPQLRVKGVTGLRVADASVMPFLPAVNPCITTMMIGEKCADMIKSAQLTPR